LASLLSGFNLCREAFEQQCSLSYVVQDVEVPQLALANQLGAASVTQLLSCCGWASLLGGFDFCKGGETNL
jgi:hypothetical protein